MSHNKTWDDIPTLHLELDTDYEKRIKSKEGRQHDRADAAALKNILPQNLSRLQIRIGTVSKGVFDGLLLDLSASGVRIRIPKALNKGELVKIGFILNQRTIMAKATTRWVDIKQNFCDVGLQFNDLPPADAEIITQLTAATIMSRVGNVK
ncbi:MAG: PilZ domain-containing protein [Desulfobulbaceae bacterium]|nr:PilZ domain-containing protein [Desulfobulbaceae bacterium]